MSDTKDVVEVVVHFFRESPALILLIGLVLLAPVCLPQGARDYLEIDKTLGNTRGWFASNTSAVCNGISAL